MVDLERNLKSSLNIEILFSDHENSHRAPRLHDELLLESTHPLISQIKGALLNVGHTLCQNTIAADQKPVADDERSRRSNRDSVVSVGAAMELLDDVDELFARLVAGQFSPYISESGEYVTLAAELFS